MQYRKLGSSDLEVSVVGIGTWVMGGNFWGAIEDKECIHAIQEGLDHGINLVDTAPGYGWGHSERLVGKAIKGRRDNVILATKVGILKDGNGMVKNLKAESIRKEIEESLRIMDVETIDLYQIHWPDVNTPLDETLEELVKLKKQGKFRYLGVSNFSVAEMEKVMSVTELASTQPHYSLLQRDIEDDVLPFCNENNIGVLTYGSLGGGALTGKYKGFPKLAANDNRAKFYTWFNEKEWPKVQKLINTMETIGEKYNRPVSHVAINWVLSQPGVSTALVGIRNTEQAIQNAAAGSFTLSSDDLDKIEKVYNEVY